ncbi:hypothetical protein HMPREF9103_01719 [Lentilactobacillus parafarraginis F0439]|uniref:Uncharacterized protein n=1 Tax=Lentilactobacillus parafarraginis F0439 TaxID=797515 RepID=G9ZPR4_9LACO|nr:hypothetical protein HMPREF9103_01719 [Lentilactobacillus parafarraginis F0439]
MLAETVNAFPNALRISPEINPIQRCFFVFWMVSFLLSGNSVSQPLVKPFLKGMKAN